MVRSSPVGKPTAAADHQLIDLTGEGFDDDFHHHLVQCSVCLELVDADGGRSNVKLQCGHQFHLDCIGSAFNMKGTMQCPNCRNIEKGQWLYAMGSSSSSPNFDMDMWTTENHPFLLLPYGFHICPFRGIMETDDLQVAGHDYLEHHENIGQTFPPPGLAYVTYFRPHPPHAALNPAGDQMDSLNVTPFDDAYRQNEIYSAPYAFATPDADYQPWAHHSPFTPFFTTGNTNVTSIAGQQALLLNPRSLGGEPEALTRSRSSLHPSSFNQSPGTGSSLSQIMTPQPQGVFQASHPFHQHPHFMGLPWPFLPGTRRSSSGPRGLSTASPAAAGRPYNPRAATGSYHPSSFASSSYSLHGTEHVAAPNYYSNAWGRDRIHHFPAPL